MLGTKWPSMTSTWIQSAPAASSARTSSPKRAKSAARIDGAMASGRMEASEWRSRNTAAGSGQRLAARNAALLTVFRHSAGHPLQDDRQQIDRELREAEIEPGERRDGEAGGGEHHAHVAIAGQDANSEGALKPRGSQHPPRT